MPYSEQRRKFAQRRMLENERAARALIAAEHAATKADVSSAIEQRIEDAGLPPELWPSKGAAESLIEYEGLGTMNNRRPYERFVCACGVPCIAVPHERSGKLAPITAELEMGGNITFVEQPGSANFVYRICSKEQLAADPDLRRHLNHYANCPIYGRTKKSE